MTPGETLREQAKVFRGHAANLLKTRPQTTLKTALARLLQHSKAEDIRKGIEDILPTIPDDAYLERLTTTITATVSANIYEALADFFDYVQTKDYISGTREQRKKQLERNDRARRAASAGDWDELKRIVDEQINSNSRVTEVSEA